jgi:hypothetical protein
MTITSSYEISFGSFDHNFCESSIYAIGQHPEYMNALSSLFITFIGLNGLRKPHTNFLLNILFSSFVANGVTSCFYHLYNSIGWGLMDRMSMILIATSSTYLFVYHVDKILILDNWNYLNGMNRAIHMLVAGYFTLLMTIAGLHMEDLFNTLFGFFLGSLIIYMWLVTKHQYNLHIPKNLLYLGWRGLAFIAMSGVFWLSTELLCHVFTPIKYLFGHVWWHIFVSYGGYLISLIPNYLSMRDDIKSSLHTNIVIKYDAFYIPYLQFSHNNNI